MQASKAEDIDFVHMFTNSPAATRQAVLTGLGSAGLALPKKIEPLAAGTYKRSIMSFFDLIKRLFQPSDEGMVRSEAEKLAPGRPSRPGLPLSELARRLKMTEDDVLRASKAPNA